MRIRTYHRLFSIVAATLIWGALGVLLISCGSDPRAGVAGAEASLTAAGEAIIACYSVAACHEAAPRAEIAARYDEAYDAVTKAQATADAGGTPNLAASTAALSALSTEIARLPPHN
jgi:hypothetical protein